MDEGYHCIEGEAKVLPTSTPTELEQALKEAGERIAKGGLVSFPTETVYGLGANALSPDAVKRIFEAKGRPLSDPVIVHVETLE